MEIDANSASLFTPFWRLLHVMRIDGDQANGTKLSVWLVLSMFCPFVAIAAGVVIFFSKFAGEEPLLYYVNPGLAFFPALGAAILVMLFSIISFCIGVRRTAGRQDLIALAIMFNLLPFILFLVWWFRPLY